MLFIGLTGEDVHLMRTHNRRGADDANECPQTTVQ